MSRWQALGRWAWVLALLAFPRLISACPVCFGETDAPIMRGVEASVLFMVGVTYCLIFAGVAAFLTLRRRARRLEREQAETA